MARTNINTALLEKEIRRLNILGQRVQEEANMRRFFLAAVLRRTGPITLTQVDIDETKKLLAAQAGDLKVEGLPDDSVALSFTAESRITHKAAIVPAPSPRSGRASSRG